MKMLIVEGDDVLFVIEDVDKPPYGIDTVNAQGGVSLSSVLRMALSRFFLEGVSPERPVEPVSNVVKFPNYRLPR